MNWDADCDVELAEVEAEISRARGVQPVSLAAAHRLREYIGRLERIAERLRAQREVALIADRLRARREAAL